MLGKKCTCFTAYVGCVVHPLHRPEITPHCANGKKGLLHIEDCFESTETLFGSIEDRATSELRRLAYQDGYSRGKVDAAYEDRIAQLEAALQAIIDLEGMSGSLQFVKIARAALAKEKTAQLVTQVSRITELQAVLRELLDALSIAFYTRENASRYIASIGKARQLLADAPKAEPEAQP